MSGRGRDRRAEAPTQALAASPQERNGVKQREPSLRPGRGGPEGLGGRGEAWDPNSFRRLGTAPGAGGWGGWGDPGSGGASPDREPASPGLGCSDCRRVSGRARAGRAPALPAPRARKAGETPVPPSVPAAALRPGRAGVGPFPFSFPVTSPPAVPVAPVSPVLASSVPPVSPVRPVLRVGAPSPPDPSGRPLPRSPGRRPGSYLGAALGLGGRATDRRSSAPRAGRRRAARGRAEGEGRRADRAAGSRREARAGGRASERGQLPVTHRALCRILALRSFFPGPRPRPPHLQPPLTLAGSAHGGAAWRARKEGRARGQGWRSRLLPVPVRVPFAPRTRGPIGWETALQQARSARGRGGAGPGGTGEGALGVPPSHSFEGADCFARPGKERGEQD